MDIQDNVQAKLNKLEEVTKAIQKAVPEIMELKFGCRISTYSVGMWNQKASRCYFEVINKKNLKGGSAMDSVLLLRNCGLETLNQGWLPKEGFPETIEITSYWDKLKAPQITKGNYHNDFEIIGRDITLADTLRAMNSKAIGFNIRNYYPNSIQFEKSGKLLCTWNLKKSLEGQSEKMINYLYEILVYEHTR